MRIHGFDFTENRYSKSYDKSIPTEKEVLTLCMSLTSQGSRLECRVGQIPRSEAVPFSFLVFERGDLITMDLDKL